MIDYVKSSYRREKHFVGVLKRDGQVIGHASVDAFYNPFTTYEMKARIADIRLDVGSSEPSLKGTGAYSIEGTAGGIGIAVVLSEIS